MAGHAGAEGEARVMRHLTVAETAEALHLSVPTVKRYIYEGRLLSTKLPGGQHRVPESEVTRLLSGETPPIPAPAAAEDPRIAVLERWVEDLQAEVDRLTAALEVMARFVARHHTEEAETDPTSGAAGGPKQVMILGPGCRRCDALYDTVRRVLRTLPEGEYEVTRVSDLDEITGFGPILTPALVLGDTVIASGRVPSDAALRKLLLEPPS